MLDNGKKNNLASVSVGESFPGKSVGKSSSAISHDLKIISFYHFSHLLWNSGKFKHTKVQTSIGISDHGNIQNA